MNEVPYISPGERPAARPAARRMVQVDGATPFGAVMSTVRWSADRRAGSHPVLAADEMFEPQVDVQTRRMNALRGNENTDSLRAQSETRRQQQAATNTEVGGKEKADTEVRTANDLAVSPQPAILQNVNSKSAQLPANGLPTFEEKSGPVRRNGDESGRATNVRQQNHKFNENAPVGVPQVPSITPNVNADLKVNSLARQIGQELGTPRAVQGTAGKQDAFTATLRADGLVGDARLARSATKAGSNATQLERSTPDVPPDESTSTRFDDLIRAIRVRAGGKHTTARLQLQPPQLGYMEVDVRLEGDLLRIDVRTENDEARQRVQGQSELLKSALESAGIDVEQIHVSVDRDWQHQRSHSMGAWMQNGPREQGDAGGRSSRAKPDETDSASRGRNDLEWMDGADSPSVGKLALSHGLRRVDVRV